MYLSAKMFKLYICLTFSSLALASQPSKVFNLNSLPLDNKQLLALNQSLLSNSSEFSSTQIAVINEYVDELLGHLTPFIKKNGLDTIDLPEFEEPFQWSAFFGRIIVTDGILHNLSNIRRTGRVTVVYNYPNITIKMLLGFSRVGLDAKYKVKFMGVGHRGKLEGSLKGCKFTVEININMIRLRGSLRTFKMDKLGKLSLKFYGGITEFLINIVMKVIKPLIRGIIKDILESFIISGLTTVINHVNGIICQILNDCLYLL